MRAFVALLLPFLGSWWKEGFISESFLHGFTGETCWNINYLPKICNFRIEFQQVRGCGLIFSIFSIKLRNTDNK